MSIGLPAHLAPDVVRRSFVAAQHTVAVTLLAVAMFAVLVFQSALPTATLWPALIALVPAVALLVIRRSIRTMLWIISYLVVGGVGIHLYAVVLLGQSIPVENTDGFSFLSVKVALIMIGGAVLGVWPGILCSIAGYLVAEVAVGIAKVGAGTPLSFDPAALVALVATVIVIPLIGIDNGRQMWAQPRLHRAAQDEEVALLRYRIEVKAATLMHDTVLNHLAAVADSSGEDLVPELRNQIREDVDSLVGEGWLTEPADAANHRSRLEWQHSGLFTAIQEGRMLGLDIETTGDLTAVGRLDRDTSIALGLAVKQCLVNVVKHSGTNRAEVAVYGSGSILSVMVVDTGRGFTEAATGADRLGLRSSVRKRIELVGGQVSVWSTPGRGTSIMIRVPAAGSEVLSQAGENG
ncbi:sensor histidine kinase [Terrimesophilobacter mesophilus]|uniref:ATP-binding protein n=1 Tax=Terrimesophilobacter mesophilus TaxID=433647 RepID=A0A4V3I9P2_9MICO|nr:ATP-binding protein [Terrimesophilobacter mesophilus]TFB80238.1 ATP-binding protein [Terrimesophilobacter mesophilus]